MKKVLCLLLVSVLLLGCVPLAAASGCIVIDKTWRILVPETPTAAETFAAEKLSSVLGEVFGAFNCPVSDTIFIRYALCGFAFLPRSNSDPAAFVYWFP